jgi:hypothetical protein
MKVVHDSKVSAFILNGKMQGFKASLVISLTIQLGKPLGDPWGMATAS